MRVVRLAIPQRPVEGTRQDRQRARVALGAKEVEVLEHVRRGVARALPLMAALAPAIALVADSAKRWTA